MAADPVSPEVAPVTPHSPRSARSGLTNVQATEAQVLKCKRWTMEELKAGIGLSCLSGAIAR